MRWPRLMALAPAIFSLGAFAVTLWLIIAYPRSAADGLLAVAFACIIAVVVSLGLVIVNRTQGNLVGLYLTWAGAIAMYLNARQTYYHDWVLHPSALPLDSRVVAVLQESGWWMFAAVALLFLHFPDGKLPSRRWRPIVPALVIACAVQHVFGAFEDTPFTAPLQHLSRPWGPPPAYLEVVGLAGFVALLALLLTSAASLLIRYRRARGLQRAQLKWLSFSGVLIVLYPLVCGADVLITGRAGVVSVVMGLSALVSLPVAVTIALLRYDLYDIDRVLSGTVAYAALSGVLVVVYALSISIGGILVGGGSPGAAAAATAVCALMLAPLRSRVQRQVDRRFYPPRRAALLAIEDLQLRTREGRAQPEELEYVLRQALHDPELRVGVAVPGERGFLDVEGQPVEEPAWIPVSVGDTQIGVLASSDSSIRGVLRAVAPTASSLIEVIRLRAEVASALREAQESRARLVHATNAERKRLERDLHDGAQQRLVSLGMAIRVAQRHLKDGTIDVHGLLDQVVAELATAVAELRMIAHGLRPTSLDDGLHAALSALTHTLPIPVMLDIDPEPLANDLAVTAYYVASEAVANAAKHADAGQIAVRIDRSREHIVIRIEDNGCGGANMDSGSGLMGLMDRVAAFGGVFSVDSPPGGGTVVEAVLPCAL